MLQLQDDNQNNHKVSSVDSLQVIDENKKPVSVDSLLPIDEDKKPREDETESSEDEVVDEEEIEAEDPALVQTKHDFVTSPWSRLGIIGGAFGTGFLVIFVVLNGMMDGGGKNAKKPVATPTPALTATPSEKKDGDVYAKLALAKQQEELEALNGKGKTEEKKEDTESDKSKGKEKAKNAKSGETEEKEKTRPARQPRVRQRVVAQETPPPPRRRVYREEAPEPVRLRRREVASQPIPPLRPTAPAPKIARSSNAGNSLLAKAVSNNQTVAKDPLAELDRLRSMGNVGRVEYALASTSTTEATNTNAQETTETVETARTEEDTSRSRRRRNRRSSSDAETTNNNTIEELRPRWEPNVESDNPEYANNEEGNKALNVGYNYSDEEALILEEKKPQYLVVGSFANATLVTPLLLPQASNNSNNRVQEQTNTLRFVAELEEPLYSNTGEIAIPAGTQLTVSMLSVDASSDVRAEVTAILKDETEYPISPGTISVLGEAGSPLIARPYDDKGPEIAKYDTTIGALAGLAKVGEIMNKPDEEIIEDLPLGGSRTRSRNNNRNMGGAFIEGFFGSLSETVGKRTERATQEISKRPSVWYVAKNTKITIQVNRSIKL